MSQKTCLELGRAAPQGKLPYQGSALLLTGSAEPRRSVGSGAILSVSALLRDGIASWNPSGGLLCLGVHLLQGLKWVYGGIATCDPIHVGVDLLISFVKGLKGSSQVLKVQ